MSDDPPFTPLECFKIKLQLNTIYNQTKQEAFSILIFIYPIWKQSTG